MCNGKTQHLFNGVIEGSGRERLDVWRITVIENNVSLFRLRETYEEVLFEDAGDK